MPRRRQRAMRPGTNDTHRESWSARLSWLLTVRRRRTTGHGFPGDEHDVRERIGMLVEDEHRPPAIRVPGIRREILARCVCCRSADAVDEAEFLERLRVRHVLEQRATRL